MIKSLEEKIEEAVRSSDEALTYGEVIAKCLNQHPYFPSIATNIYLSCKEVSQLDLFFDNAHEKASDISKFYVTDVLPCVKNLERRGVIKHSMTNDKENATHTNFVFDIDQKLLERLKRLSEKKRYVQPALVSIAREIVRKISNECPQEFKAYLVGSAAPKSVKPFVYYRNRDIIESVSDLDIEIFAKEYLDIKSLQPYFDEISRKRKIPLNIVVWREASESDEGMIKKALPLII
jgi:hypothetical protein